MSIKSEILRIKAARNKIRNQMVEFGISNSSDNITKLSTELAKVYNNGAVSQILSEGETYTITKGYHNGNGTVTAALTKRVLDMTTIDKGQFLNGNGLKGVKILMLPNVERIESNAFYGAPELEMVDIGLNIQYTHSHAFANCTNLTKLIFRGFFAADGYVLLLEGTPIGNKEEGAYIYVDDEYLEEWKAHTLFHDYLDRLKPLSELDSGGRLQSKTVLPSEALNKVLPDEGYYALSDVTVEAIPENYADITGVTATAEDVLFGEVFVANDGNVAVGTMPQQGAVDMSVYPLKSKITIPEGYHNGEGTVLALTEELTVQADREETMVCVAGPKFWTKVTVEPATGGGVEAPYSGAVYPWLELDIVAVADNQFREGAGLNGARTVIIPDVETIGTAAFLSAKEVEIIDIGPNVTSVHFAAFNNCTKLKKLIFRGLWLAPEKKLTLSATPIASIDGGYIYVPDEYLEQYKTATNWADWATQIKPISEL